LLTQLGVVKTNNSIRHFTWRHTCTSAHVSLNICLGKNCSEQICRVQKTFYELDT